MELQSIINMSDIQPEELKLISPFKYCPVHGELTEDLILLSAGQAVCGVFIDFDQICFKTLEESNNGNSNQ